MKNAITFAVLLIILGASPVVADEKLTQSVVFDYLTGFLYREGSDGKLVPTGHRPSTSAGKPVQFRVVNLNSFRYSVVISARSSPLFTAVPEQLSGLIVKSNQPLDDSGIQAITSNITLPKGAASPSPKALLTAANAISSNLKELESQIGELEDLSNIDNVLINIARSAPDPQLTNRPLADPREQSKPILEEVRRQVQSVVAGKLTGPVAKGEKAQANPTANDFLRTGDDLFKQVSRKYQELEDRYDDYQIYARTLSANLAVAKGASNVANDPEETAKLDFQVEKLNKRIQDRFSLATEKLGTLRAQSEDRRKKLASASRIYNRIMSEDIFETRSIPISPQGDVVRFTIQITPLPEPGQSTQAIGKGPSEQTQTNQPPPVEVEVKVTGRTKIDFSTGLFFTNLVDKDYFASNENGQTVVRSKASDKFSASLGGLLHLYRTSSSSFVPALSFGIGALDQGPQYFLGMSAIVGESQRFIFTVGVAARKVRRLAGSLEEGGQFAGGGDVPTSSVFRTGLFLGVSFNLR